MVQWASWPTAPYQLIEGMLLKVIYQFDQLVFFCVAHAPRLTEAPVDASVNLDDEDQANYRLYYY